MIKFQKPDRGAKGDFKSICRAYDFVQRGDTFFRVWGDGVLQVVRCRRERPLYEDVILVGLFSMYGELMQQWFTSLGAIPRYSVLNCFQQNEIPLIYAPALSVQLDMLRTGVMPWLNSIDTQKKLVTAITKLDSRWNDDLKIGPYLACGEDNHAKKVIKEILAQHRIADSNRGYVTEDYRLCRQKEDAALYALIDMIDEGEKNIQRYLHENYERNISYAKFCMRKEKI